MPQLRCGQNLLLKEIVFCFSPDGSPQDCPTWVRSGVCPNRGKIELPAGKEPEASCASVYAGKDDSTASGDDDDATSESGDDDGSEAPAQSPCIPTGKSGNISIPPPTACTPFDLDAYCDSLADATPVDPACGDGLLALQARLGLKKLSWEDFDKLFGKLDSKNVKGLKDQLVKLNDAIKQSPDRTVGLLVGLLDKRRPVKVGRARRPKVKLVIDVAPLFRM